MVDLKKEVVCDVRDLTFMIWTIASIRHVWREGYIL